jgi:LPXTG-motif cell wall-anchored protein
MVWSRRRLAIAPLALAGALSMSPFLVGTASAAPGLAAYGPAHCTVTVSISPKPPIAAGSTITITLSGTCGNRTFTVTLHSASITLGSITTDASGAGSGAFTIPASTTPGTHTIVVSDTVGDSSAITITVLAAAPAAATPAAPQGSNSLPLTGTDAAALGAVGAGAIGVGGMLVLGSRRRRAASFR